MRSSFIERLVGRILLLLQSTAHIFGGMFLAYILGTQGVTIFAVPILMVVCFQLHRMYLERGWRFTYKEMDLIENNKRLNKDQETINWLNALVERAYPSVSPFVDEQVANALRGVFEKVISEKKPPFLKEIKLKKFILGSTSPNLENVQFFTKDDPNLFVFDIDVGYSGEFRMTLKITAEVNDKKINLPIVINNVHVETRARVELNFCTELPFVKVFSLALKTIPSINVSVYPLKSLDVMSVPGLQHWAQKTIGEILTDVLVLPNKIEVPLLDIMKANREAVQEIKENTKEPVNPNQDPKEQIEKIEEKIDSGSKDETPKKKSIFGMFKHKTEAKDKHKDDKPTEKKGGFLRMSKKGSKDGENSIKEGDKISKKKSDASDQLKKSPSSDDDGKTKSSESLEGESKKARRRSLIQEEGNLPSRTD